MLTELQKQKLPTLFAQHDADRDGFLTRADHEAQGQRIAQFKGWAPESPQATEMTERFVKFWQGLAQTADVNDDARVSMNEWYGYWDAILSSPDMYAMIVKPISQSALGMMDRDDDGKVSLDDFVEYLGWSKVDPNVAHDSFQRLDLNRDGFLTTDESMELVEQYFRSDDPSAPGNWFFGPW